MSGPRFAFAGTAPFAELVLGHLLEAGRVPVVVVTNPDRPRGRHGTPQPPGVKVMAAERGIPVLQPPRVSEPAAIDELLAFAPEVLAVCAYGQIVGRPLLEALRVIVTHPSLVPHWRGAAPVERALMAGETDLGVTTLKMSEGVDEGPVGDTRHVHVPPDADAGRAYELLAGPAAAGLAAVLDALAAGTVHWEEQRGSPDYAAKIGPDDKLIDWSRPAVEIVEPGAGAVAAPRRRHGAARQAHVRVARGGGGGAVARARARATRVRRRRRLGRRARSAAGRAREDGRRGVPPRRRARAGGTLMASAITRDVLPLRAGPPKAGRP